MQTRTFCNAVARRLVGVDRDEVDRVLQAIIAEAKEQLYEGEEVRFPGLGKLVVKHHYRRWIPLFVPFSKFEQDFRAKFVEYRDQKK